MRGRDEVELADNDEGQTEDINVLHLMISSVTNDSVGLSFLVSTTCLQYVLQLLEHLPLRILDRIQEPLIFFWLYFFYFSLLTFTLVNFFCLLSLPSNFCEHFRASQLFFEFAIILFYPRFSSILSSFCCLLTPLQCSILYMIFLLLISYFFFLSVSYIFFLYFSLSFSSVLPLYVLSSMKFLYRLIAAVWAVLRYLQLQLQLRILQPTLPRSLPHNSITKNHMTISLRGIRIAVQQYMSLVRRNKKILSFWLWLTFLKKIFIGSLVSTYIQIADFSILCFLYIYSTCLLFSHIISWVSYLFFNLGEIKSIHASRIFPDITFHYFFIC